MLIEKVIDHYSEVGKKHPRNPFRLSNSGRCARALAYQRFQSIFKSEPMPARVLMVLEEGKRVDKMVKRGIHKALRKIMALGRKRVLYRGRRDKDFRPCRRGTHVGNIRAHRRRAEKHGQLRFPQRPSGKDRLWLPLPA